MASVDMERRNDQCPFIFEFQVEFLLYTRANRNIPQDISRDSRNIRQSNYRGSQNTKFIIHGFKASATKSWVLAMKDALLEKVSAPHSEEYGKIKQMVSDKNNQNQCPILETIMGWLVD